MRNIKITVEYDGTDFAGWQRQKNVLSIQQCIEEAGKKTFQQPIPLAGAGRTDAGVHACGQVANFPIRHTIPTDRIPFALNTHLPESVRVLAAEEVPPGFHACRDAAGKHYRYTIWNGRIHPAILRRYTSVCNEALSFDVMQEAVTYMTGKHDFRAFRTNAKGQEHRSTVKEIFHAQLVRCGRLIFLDVIGDGFLYNQVRTMAGTLIEAGRGKMAPDTVKTILESGDRRLAGPTAPARGLCLIRVFYGRVPAEALDPPNHPLYFSFMPAATRD